METRSTPKPTTHTFPKNPLEFYIAKEAARYGHKKTFTIYKSWLLCGF